MFVTTKNKNKSKNLFSESCLKWPHYYREVISDFYLGGLRQIRQIKSCFDQKICFAKVSIHITIEKWSSFLDLGSVSWPRRCCRRCGVAGGERVPPAPLGWYLTISVILLYLGLYQCHLGASRCILVNLGLSRTIWGLHFFDMDCFWIKNFLDPIFFDENINNNDHNFNGFWRNWNYPSLWDIWTV